MIVNIIKGDLVLMIENNTKDMSRKLISAGQGCNCHIRQGSGIAGQLRKFPEIFQADVDFGRSGDRTKLGEYSRAILDNVDFYNIYSQYDYGTDKMNVDYTAISQALVELDLHWQKHEIKRPLYLPKIGAGLAGGDWDFIEHIINESTPYMEVIIVDYVQGVDPLD